MNRFAINVVLLPPNAIMDFVLEWNKKLREEFSGNIVLGKTNYLPHISLAMGCLREDQLENAYLLLRSIAMRHKVLQLRSKGIHYVTTTTGNIVATLDIWPDTPLRALHQSIAQEFSPMLTHDAEATDLADDYFVDLPTLDWINNFIPHASFENFWPHITIGLGSLPNNVERTTFQVSRLAICHLANHSTCKTILNEVTLGL